MQTRINAETAEQIVRTVSDISGRDINFISPDGMIIASTDKKRVGTYHEIGHRAAAEGKDLEAEETDTFRGTKAGVNLPFLWKGETIAVIGITGKPDEVRKYAQLAQRITRLILKERELELLDRSRQAQAGYIVRQLLQGETARSGFYADYLQKNGFDEHSMLRMVAARISTRYNPANLTLAEEEIYRVFRSGGSPLYTFLYPDQYVLILKERSYRDMRGVLEKLAWDMKNFLAVGVGSAEKLPDISRSYRSAMLAASAASPGILAEYDRLHTELLLGTLSDEAMELYVRRVLSHLSEKDIQYLDAYFRSNCSLKEAAAELYIHKNTLQYRLDRVRDLSGYDPRFFADAADLMLALKCRSLLQRHH
jgi:carbohydrate diacid regulator